MKKAAALEYDKGSNKAPKLLAKGKGQIAETIIEKAKEFDIPIFQNESLINSLMDLNIDAEIPPRLYNAVVEVFVWLYNSEQKAGLSAD